MRYKKDKKPTKIVKLVILDYITCIMHIYKIDASIFVNPKYIRDLGFNPDNVVYMFGDIETRNHKGVLLNYSKDDE